MRYGKSLPSQSLLSDSLLIALESLHTLGRAWNLDDASKMNNDLYTTSITYCLNHVSSGHMLDQKNATISLAPTDYMQLFSDSTMLT